jgi:membrane protein DedA with SNARE-associated domain
MQSTGASPNAREADAMSDWVIRLIEQSGYLGVGFLMFLETIFPPIPSEIIMPVAGVAAGQGRMWLPFVIASGAAGAMLGNIVWYLAARAIGLIRFKPFIHRHGRWLTINWAEVERADRWFRRHGIAFVLLGRMIPTIRSLVSVPAGLLHMRFRNFVIASTIGTVGWTSLLTIAGYKMGERYRDIDQIIGPLSNAVLAGLVIIYLWRVIRHNPSGEAD